jgi:hypothetical protein
MLRRLYIFEEKLLSMPKTCKIYIDKKPTDLQCICLSDENINLDAEFQPNLLNSAVYLVSLIMQVSTFAINYQVNSQDLDFCI